MLENSIMLKPENKEVTKNIYYMKRKILQPKYNYEEDRWKKDLLGVIRRTCTTVLRSIKSNCTQNSGSIYWGIF